MCTALSFKINNKCFFGRNMDLPYFFGQRPIFIPAGFEYLNRVSAKNDVLQKSILGMGTIIDGHPAMAEAMNNKGLACAGLNFSGYACFSSQTDNTKVNIAPYDFILWALSNFSTVKEVQNACKKLNLVSIPINESTPVSQLHWMLCDRSGDSIVVEATESGILVYDNPVGVMTNNPEFPWHITNLREYLKISAANPENANWSNFELSPLGVGAGTLGMPGDFSSVSRFVRAAFIKANLPKDIEPGDEVGQFFHMLDYCAMVKGGVLTADGVYDYTTYSSCMDLTSGIYYFKNYNNSRINAVSLCNCKSSEVVSFPYVDTQDIKYLN